ncbi:class I SAM-dependent methyltransferase [Rhodobacteraceae bacterium NNCM2]|nr:class I SAM-dependent methyltransferase [Coraliihabitans acroporae]
MTDRAFASFAEVPWRRADREVPEAARRVPTMLCEDESRLLYWLGRHWATGAGATCDLGCFAGGSTARLAAGLADAGVTAPVRAYDFFTVAPDHKDKFLYANGVAAFEGNDMLPVVESLLSPWRDLVTLHRGDVAEQSWNSGPIEILFIDVMKTPETADAIARNFYPSLIPGRSVIVHQDYQHWRQPWIAAQMSRLRGAFRPVAWAEAGTTVFAVDRLPERDEMKWAAVSGMTDDEMTEILYDALAEAPAGPSRQHLARSILALEDCPGCRLPYRFDPKDFNRQRLRAVIEAVT